jgi:LysM repeat protein
MKAQVFISVLAFHIVVIAGLYLLSACSSSKTPATDQSNAGSPTGGSVYDRYSTPNRPTEDDNMVVTTANQPDQDAGLDSVFNSGSNRYQNTTTNSGRGRSQPRRPEGNDFGVQNTPALNEFIEEEVLQPIDNGVPLTASIEYLVQKGDSLWKISKEFGISLNALLVANGLSENSTIQIGQSLEIPSSAAGPPSSSAPSFSGSQSEVYTVVGGDTLSRIAIKFNTTVNDIKVANGLRSDIIQLNQRLTIPVNSVSSGGSRVAPLQVAPAQVTPSPAPAPVSGEVVQGDIVHVVQRGETPSGIARQYGITTSQLMTDNAISDPRKIAVGQKLQIRLGTAQLSTPPGSTTTQPINRPISTPTLFDDSLFDDLEDFPEVEVVPRS